LTGTSSCDVVVVGGGAAGAATATMLAGQGLATTVVEWAVGSPFRIGETVPADIAPLLDRLGMLEEFLGDGHLPAAATASAWGSADLAWRDAFVPALGAGWHLDRRRFDGRLLDQAGRRGAAIRRGRRVVGARRTGDGKWALRLGARDGSAETLARRLGAAPLVDDRLVCVFGVLDLPPGVPADARTVIESAEDGWWYAGHVGGSRAVAGFFTDSDLLRHRSALRPEAWHHLLRRTHHLFDLLGRPLAPTSVRLVCARSHRLDHAAGDRWLAVGDAAMAWDPLTSAGLVLALRSALRAGQVVPRLLTGDADAGTQYAGQLAAAHSRYLAERGAYYALEHRWPASEFWRRRTCAAVTVQAVLRQ
jgi:flavin-dependent dehydrogenase